MLRGVPPAAGPTGTVGLVARATPELHSAVRSGTAGRGPSRDHGPRAGRGSYASTHAHLGTSGCGTLWELWAASGPEELRDSELTYASTHAYLGTAGCGTHKGTVGCELAGCQ
jgi:hypothetical protein